MRKKLLFVLIPVFVLLIAGGIFLLTYENENYYKKEYVYEKILGKTYLFRNNNYENEYDEDGYNTYYSDLYISFVSENRLLTSNNNDCRYEVKENKIKGTELVIHNIEIFGDSYSKVTMKLELEPDDYQRDIYGENFVYLRIYNKSKEIAHTYPDFTFTIYDCVDNMLFDKVNSTSDYNIENSPLAEKISTIELNSNNNCKITIDGVIKEGEYIAVRKIDNDFPSYIFVKLYGGNQIVFTSYQGSGHWNNENLTISLQYN